MRLREQIVKANLLVREASYIAEELDKRTEYKVTLQIPASSLDANRKVRKQSYCWIKSLLCYLDVVVVGFVLVPIRALRSLDCLYWPSSLEQNLLPITYLCAYAYFIHWKYP